MRNMQMEALDFRYLLLEYYKKLRISEDELAVIFMIDHLLGQKNTLITPDLLSLKMNLSIKELDKILVNLIERNFLIYDIGKKIKISLKPLQKRLYETFQVALAKEQEINSDKEKSKCLENIYQIFENKLERSLSPLEFSLIGEWINDGFSDDEIVAALDEALSKNKKTIKAVDKILVTYKNKMNFDKQGKSVAKEVWDDDIEKTIEIAKAKWTDD